LSTRRDLLDRWLHKSYGGDGLVNKATVLHLATEEVEQHAQMVQSELDRQKHERELQSRKNNAATTRRTAGKLRRHRGTSSRATPPLRSATVNLHVRHDRVLLVGMFACHPLRLLACSLALVVVGAKVGTSTGTGSDEIDADPISPFGEDEDPATSRKKGVSFDLKGNTTSLIR
jgi:hypothetical protein